MFIRRLRLFHEMFSLSPVNRQAAFAILTGRLTRYAQTNYMSSTLASNEWKSWLRSALPLIKDDSIAAIHDHTLLGDLLDVGLLQTAVQRQDSTLLRILAKSPVFLNHYSFEDAMFTLGNTQLENPTLVSLVMAAKADSSIAKEDWRDFAQGLVTGARRRGPGVIAWAYMADLPVLDCLPVREYITEAYGTLPDEGTFRLLLNITRSGSGHEQIALKQLLDSCSDTPEGCLTSPNPAFLEGCAHLKGV